MLLFFSLDQGALFFLDLFAPLSRSSCPRTWTHSAGLRRGGSLTFQPLGKHGPVLIQLLVDDPTPDPQIGDPPPSELRREIVQGHPEVITHTAEGALIVEVRGRCPAQRAGHAAVSPNPMEKTRTPPVSSLSPWAFPHI